MLARKLAKAITVLCMTTALWAASPAGAGEVYYQERQDHFMVYVAGTIDKQTYDEYRAVMQLYLDKKINKGIRVFLNSTGGDLDYAFSIGRLIYAGRAETWIAAPNLKDNGATISPARCASACGLLFIAGRERVMMEKSELGVHRFTCKKCSAERAQETVADLFTYTRNVGVNPVFIESWFATKSSEMYYIPHDKLVKSKIMTSTAAQYSAAVNPRVAQR